MNDIVAAKIPKRKLYFASGQRSGCEIVEKFALYEDGSLCEYKLFDNDSLPEQGDIFCVRAGDCFKETSQSFAILKESGGRQIRGFLNSSDHSPGDNILVTVTAPATGNKYCRLNEGVTLSGRYIVLYCGHGNGGVNISRRINDDIVRDRLDETGKNLIGSPALSALGLPEKLQPGIIFRTASENASDQDLKEEFEGLSGDLSAIVKKYDQLKSNKSFGLIYSPDVLTLKLLEYSSGSISEIHIDSPVLAEKALKLTGIRPENMIMHRRGYFETEGIDKEFARLSGRTVYLPSGGNIIIDRTEAMTVIDVNSSGASSGSNKSNSPNEINCEAAAEIARQLRLRSITGTVICDFISTESDSNEQEIVAIMKEKLSKDPARTEIFGFTRLKLLEMTRSKGVFA